MAVMPKKNGLVREGISASHGPSKRRVPFIEGRIRSMTRKALDMAQKVSAMLFVIVALTKTSYSSFTF